MIFWVIIAAIIITAIWLTWREDAFIGLLVVPFIGAMVLGVVMLILCATLPDSYYKEVSSETTSLRSIGAGDGISGRSHFLAGGYIESKKVLSFIRVEDDGASRLVSADAEQSRIYEVDESPTVTTRTYLKRAWWLAPFPVGVMDNYEFRVPNGTVSDDYTINTKGTP